MAPLPVSHADKTASKEPIVIKVQKEYFTQMKDGVYMSEDWSSDGISSVSKLVNLK